MGKRNPAYAVYDRAPCATEGVYVIDLGNSRVKVGRSRSLYSRLCEVHRRLCSRGFAPQGFAYFRADDSYSAERIALQRLRLVATPIDGREIFDGIAFDAAASLLEAVAAECSPS